VAITACYGIVHLRRKRHLMVARCHVCGFGSHSPSANDYTGRFSGYLPMQ
jgi:hypothetical protein